MFFPSTEPTSRRFSSRLAVGLAVVVGALTFSSVANAQTTPGIVPPASTIVTKDIRIEIGIPVASIPTNVSGFRVNMLCAASPATFDGNWTAIATFTATGQSVAIPTPFNDTTQCNVRLTVLGTGARPLVLTANSVDAANVSFRYLGVVDGVTVDPQTVIEIGPLLVKPLQTVRFGAAAPAPTTTTTVAPTTTTIAATTTTVAATTTTTTTTTTAAPTTTLATLPPTTQPPPTVTKAPARRVVRIVRVCAKRVNGKCVKTRLVRRTVG